MKYLDCVRVIAEKEKYAKCGVHKGMQGVVWDGVCRSGEYSCTLPSVVKSRI